MISFVHHDAQFVMNKFPLCLLGNVTWEHVKSADHVLKPKLGPAFHRKSSKALRPHSTIESRDSQAKTVSKDFAIYKFPWNFRVCRSRAITLIKLQHSFSVLQSTGQYTRRHKKKNMQKENMKLRGKHDLRSWE